MGSGRTYVIGSFNLHNLSRNRATRDQAVQICNIIMHEGMDLIAMQEVLDDRALDNIMACLGYNWEKVWIQPTVRKGMEGVDKDPRGEGYAFIWNSKRLKKVDTILTNGQKRIYEPRIFNQYKIDRNAGQKDLIRNPLYGRFTPRDLGGGNFEIRLICTHIRYKGPKGESDPSHTQMRQNEFDVLTKALYPKLADRIYGDMMPAYTILLGDYNLNLNRGWTKSPYITEPVVILKDGTNEKKIITVQDQLTTLKQPQKDNPDMSERGYASNYDHFSYDEIRLGTIHPRYRRVNVVGEKFYVRYFNDFDTYRKEISDHIPIIIELTPNANDLSGGDKNGEKR